jgi:hypothetical protein
MERCVEVQNAPPTMLNNEEAIQSAEIKIGNGEEVERRDGVTMIVQKGQPLARVAFLWRALEPLQIARHGRFGNVETEQ